MLLMGLLLGMIVMPTMVHAASSSSAHGSEMLVVEGIQEADHSHSQGADKDLPCHAVSHHHCGMGLQLDAPRNNLNGLGKDALLHPAAPMPLISRSQAPPLNPPLA